MNHGADIGQVITNHPHPLPHPITLGLLLPGVQVKKLASAILRAATKRIADPLH